MTPAERPCGWCEESFQPHPSATEKRYCSVKCGAQARRQRVIDKYPPRDQVVALYVDEGLTDQELGRHFGHSAQWAMLLRRHYGIAGRPAGKKRKPRRKLSDRNRWAIKLKPEERCRNCQREGGPLHLHHAVPRSLAPAGKYDLRNGVPLCVRCHMGWHNRTVVIHRDVFTDAEWAFVRTLIGPFWLDQRYPTRWSAA